MTISKEALQFIGDLSLAGAGKSLDTYTPVALVPNSSNLVDLEKYQAGRSRFRGTSPMWWSGPHQTPVASSIKTPCAVSCCSTSARRQPLAMPTTARCSL